MAASSQTGLLKSNISTAIYSIINNMYVAYNKIVLFRILWTWIVRIKSPMSTI